MKITQDIEPRMENDYGLAVLVSGATRPSSFSIFWLLRPAYCAWPSPQCAGRSLRLSPTGRSRWPAPVSYTHLDVYKRQLLLILLSACFQKSLYPCLMGLGLGVALNYCAGWALSPVWWKQVLACISPFTLTSGSKLLESLSGVSIGGIYLLRLFVVLIVQAVIACLLVIAIRRKSCCK